MREKRITKKLQAEIGRFNKRCAVGGKVRYWTFVREGDGVVSTTRTEAQALGTHTAVVWVEGQPGCIALSHVEIV